MVYLCGIKIYNPIDTQLHTKPMKVGRIQNQFFVSVFLLLVSIQTYDHCFVEKKGTDIVSIVNRV
jgi:hypothetical protein